MNLKDFEQDINRTILRRGREYYKDGRVELAVFGDGVYSASVAGSHDYAVVVELDADKNIIDVECDCPYTDGPHCKHMVAVFYAIIDRSHGISAVKKPEDSKVVQLFPTVKQAENVTPSGSKEELASILSMQSKERLIELLTLLADDSEVNRDYLQAQLTSGTEEVAGWVRLMHRHIEDAMDEDGFISCSDCQYAIEGAFMVLERVQRAFDEGNYELGVDLALCVLHDMVELLAYADDSNGDIGDVIYEAKGLLACIVDQTLSDSVREHCFQKLLVAAGDSVYDGWIEWSMDLLDICTELAVTLEDRRSLEQYLNKTMVKVKKVECEPAGLWRNNYDAERVALINLTVISKFDGLAKATNFLHENICFPRFRELAIQQVMDSEEYELVEKIALDGEKQDKSLPGLVQQWKEARFKAYQKSGQVEKLRKLGLELALDGNFDYYMKLKKTYNSVEWLDIYPGIIEAMDKEKGYIRDIYTKILIEEKEWKKLLEYVQNNSARIVDYYRYLIKDYRLEVYKVFMKFISDSAQAANDRKGYQKVCSYLRLLVKIGGGKEASELIETFLRIYKRRPALKEELLAVKLSKA